MERKGERKFIQNKMKKKNFICMKENIRRSKNNARNEKERKSRSTGRRKC